MTPVPSRASCQREAEELARAVSERRFAVRAIEED
jgi:hypothetical protein